MSAIRNFQSFLISPRETIPNRVVSICSTLTLLWAFHCIRLMVTSWEIGHEILPWNYSCNLPLTSGRTNSNSFFFFLIWKNPTFKTNCLLEDLKPFELISWPQLCFKWITRFLKILQDQHFQQKGWGLLTFSHIWVWQEIIKQVLTWK